MDENSQSATVHTYEAQIKDEARFWGRVTDDTLQHGIPPWVDFRRATDFKRDIPGPWDDLRMHQILSGEPLCFMLAEASEVKGAQVLGFGVWRRLAQPGISTKRVIRTLVETTR